jgi:NTP pyrophosphatase (non-canonical NTP hydrolase)
VSWQRQVAAFARAHGLLHDPATHALDLASEVGEVAKEVLRATHYGCQPFRAGPELAAELGDALYSLLALAESCGVDAGEALEKALAKYERRLAQHGAAGSQRETSNLESRISNLEPKA